MAELSAGQFSLAKFYERRARRILPPMFFMMAFTLPFAWFLLLPRDLQNFAQSLVAVSTFSSNILFWIESGYFDTASHLKPLLHTWSLAVEEQYYVTFPLILMSLWKIGRLTIIVILAALAVASFGLAQWATVTMPSAAFFMLPTRGWELLLGALTAFFWSSGKKPIPRSVTAQVLGLLGIAGLIYAIVFFDETTPFPGIFALVPTVATALLIVYATPGTWVHRLLCQRVFVGVGLISYSAYLWHQPVLAFARNYSSREPPEAVMLALCLAVVPMAYLSWRFVERPFRQKDRIRRSTVLLLAAASSAAFIVFGVIGHVTKGFESYWLSSRPVQVQKSYKLVESTWQEEISIRGYDDGACRFHSKGLTSHEAKRILACYEQHGPAVVILGDSHAFDLYRLVVASNPEMPFLIGVTSGGCRPHTPKSGCQYDDFLAFVSANEEVFSRIVYEQAGFYLLRSDNQLGSREMFLDIPIEGAVQGILPNLDYVVLVREYLSKLSVLVPVTWFGPRMEPHIGSKDIITLGCEHDFRLRGNTEDLYTNLDEKILETVQDSEGLTFLSQNKSFRFNFPEDFMNCDDLYWSDGDHFSTSGEKRFGQRFDLLGHIN